MAASACSKPALFLLSFVTLFLIASNVPSVEAADREWSWLQWAKEKLRLEVGIETELAKEFTDKLLSRKQNFATDVVSEGIDAIAKSVGVGGGGGGGGDKEKWASWMEWGKEKLKQELEKQSDSAKAQLATALDAAHDFVESLVDEIGSDDNKDGSGKEDKRGDDDDKEEL